MTAEGRGKRRAKGDGRREGKFGRLDFYPGDYLSDAKVIAMTWEAQGAYCRFLFISWMSGPLPDDLGTLARILGGSEKQLRKLWPQIEPCLAQGPAPGTLVQPRLERERQRAIENRASKREGAERTNERRWGSHSDSHDASLSDRSATPGSDRPSASASASASHTPPTPSGGRGSAPPDGAARVCAEKSQRPEPPEPDPPAGIAPSSPQPPGDPPTAAARPGPEPTADTDDRFAALWAAWQDGRASRKLPPDRWSAKHASTFDDLLDKSAEDRDFACEVIRAYFGWDDEKLRGVAWGINLFPFRMDACFPVAEEAREKAMRRRRAAAAEAEAEREIELTPEELERIAESRRKIREMLRQRRPQGGADSTAGGTDAEKESA